MRSKKLKSSHPVALMVADLHLTLKAPVCRAEEDWMLVQKAYLNQLEIIQRKYSREKDELLDSEGSLLPILCAGDIFDRWNVQPELINFALRYLPNKMYCVPGQHDLPNHRMEERHRSAYGVLEEAGKIRHVDEPCELEDFWLHGFGWGKEIKPLNGRPPNVLTRAESWSGIHVALIHHFIWTNQTGYPGAPEGSFWSMMAVKLKGYDVCVFGDNHKPFEMPCNGAKTMIYNCGGFIRRKTDEKENRPRVGIIRSNGLIDYHFLDVSGDRILSDKKIEEKEHMNLTEFVEDLGRLGDDAMDFREIVLRRLKSPDISPAVREVIRLCLDPESASRNSLR